MIPFILWIQNSTSNQPKKEYFLLHFRIITSFAFQSSGRIFVNFVVQTRPWFLQGIASHEAGERLSDERIIMNCDVHFIKHYFYSLLRLKKKQSIYIYSDKFVNNQYNQPERNFGFGHDIYSKRKRKELDGFGLYYMFDSSISIYHISNVLLQLLVRPENQHVFSK